MSLLDEWHRLVEEVASISSTEPLPKDYIPTDFLPGGREVPEALLQLVRAGAAAFDAESRTLFRPQMTPEEGCHAAPVVTRHGAASPSSFAAPQAGKEGVEDTNNTNGDANGDKPQTSMHEGPNFFEAYNAHATATKRNGDKVSLAGINLATAAASSVPRSLGTASRLASGFLLPEYYAQKHRQPDFIPIILVPASVSSLLQLFNIREFLERGVYVDPPSLFVDAKTGAVNVQESKPDAVIVTPGSFLDAEKYTVAYKVFRVVDDPKQVKNWQHVCACIVDGNEWQFRGWYPNEATPVPVSELFQRVCGFLPYLEEDKLPSALQQWHVKPLPLTRRVVKAHAHILQASVFWEHLYTFLETHPFFKLYTVPLD
ncbi:parafibromin [Trypanosoma grayi]|uniref:parafibromin n=1 Tax=Trypanosoma grayi TaxID=71804 RepID=UPI0004F4546A|nr:parafibromin [Trypanosoma grayi]KEG11160.1 parafibromin [Trypanosoma grayi]